MVELNPVPVLGVKENTSTIWRKFFTEMSVQMVSALFLVSFVCQNASFKSHLLLWLWFHVIQYSQYLRSGYESIIK